jgi:hypothetical protein
MKKCVLAALTLLLIYASFTFAAPPYTYSGTRVDQGITQLPNPLPTWGGAAGAGAKWCDPNFKNFCHIRLTDRTTHKGESLEVTPNGISIDDKHIIVQATGGGKTIIAFDPVLHTVQATGANILTDVIFSSVNPSLLFSLSGTQVNTLTTTDWVNFTPTLMYDFTSCLGIPTKNITWHGDWQVPLGDGVYTVAYSDRGGQGSGEYVIAYQVASKTCSLFNTLTGIVYVNGKAIGTIDDGTKVANKARFTIHDSAITRNPNYLHVMPSINDPTGGSGCKSGQGTCNNGSVYYWEIGTTHLVPCIGCSTGGHAAEGYAGAYHGYNTDYRYYADPTKPKTLNGNLPSYSKLDFHSSYFDALATNADTQAFFVGNAVVTTKPITKYPIWGFNELFVIQPGAKPVINRFGQTRNTGMSPYYVCQNATGDISPSAKFIIYTSDQGGKNMLGTDDNKNSACDVFIVPLTQ